MQPSIPDLLKITAIIKVDLGTIRYKDEEMGAAIRRGFIHGGKFQTVELSRKSLWIFYPAMKFTSNLNECPQMLSE
jgi:hypothetical protein